MPPPPCRHMLSPPAEVAELARRPCPAPATPRHWWQSAQGGMLPYHINPNPIQHGLVHGLTPRRGAGRAGRGAAHVADFRDLHRPAPQCVQRLSGGNPDPCTKGCACLQTCAGLHRNASSAYAAEILVLARGGLRVRYLHWPAPQRFQRLSGRNPRSLHDKFCTLAKCFS